MKTLNNKVLQSLSASFVPIKELRSLYVYIYVFDTVFFWHGYISSIPI